jgi:L-seryl-tRNA(Ser) seleniumtransferase
VDSPFRALPAVHELLDEPQLAAYARALGPGTVRTAVRDALGEARRRIASGSDEGPTYASLVATVSARLAQVEADGLLPVLNGTGILLHTNLGRAPLAAEALDAIVAIGRGYSNLEFDLEGGRRGSRYARVSGLLRETTGAPDAIVVNNCAAAILLVLDTFAKGREVIVSRNQLIEIGGGFRLPDVLARSGARLVEVGTTNRVYLRDFEEALTWDTALLMRTHPSNFRIEGFVADVAGPELVALARKREITTLEDLGSGALIDLVPYGLPHERTVAEALADGIDLIAFSGDKLLGGPQAGIVVGGAAAIARLRANPLLRALRVDKVTLAALAATLRLYTEPGGIERVPLYAMLAQTPEALRARAQRLRDALGSARARIEVIATSGFVGGGALPTAALPSSALALRPHDATPDVLAERARRGRPALVGRVDEGSFIVDLRTIAPADDERLNAALRTALA